MRSHPIALPVALAMILAASACTCEPPPRTEIPELRAPRRSGEIALDGILSEPDWQHAPRTAPFVHTMDGTAGAPHAIARLLWDETHLYAAFDVEDDYLVCTFEGRDAHLWEQDAVELMIDPDGDGEGYFELQVSPTDLVFDTRFDTVRRPAPFGYPSFSSGIETGVHVDGTPNDDDDDDGYTVELRIPWTAFGEGRDPAGPPRAGDTWRIALYVLDARRDGQRGVGWSPPLVGDFHVPDRFGRVTFAGAETAPR